MILSFSGPTMRARETVVATVTTEHAASSYGQPVVVLDDGQTLDAFSWAANSFEVEEATEEEIEGLKKALWGV